jgi:hypothetical protein
MSEGTSFPDKGDLGHFSIGYIKKKNNVFENFITCLGERAWRMEKRGEGRGRGFSTHHMVIL